MEGHRHTLGHEHDHEPQPGLPEALPATEKLLWQGRPSVRAMAIEVFHLRKVALWFALLLGVSAALVVSDGGGVAAVYDALIWPLVLSLLCLAVMFALARQAALSTAYTITSKRVVMRIGIVLSVTFNLPFSRIAGAGVLKRDRGAGGHGDIALSLLKGERIAILQLWPHARPWHVRQPQPMLRGLDDVAEVAAILSSAWSAATGIAATTAPSGAATARPAAGDAPVPSALQPT
jgi:hypothetical protein